MMEASLLIYQQLGYEDAWALQHRLVDQRAQDQCPDTLLLLQHPPVYTVGRSGRPEHWPTAVSQDAACLSGIPVHHVERGGSVTYHGPGQIVGYPILRLNQYCPGPKAYMRRLEDVLIRTLCDWGIAATRRDALTGVWVQENGFAKIAALGVRIVRGITMHGFALNVTMDLTPFERIVPCGLVACRVTSMAHHLGAAVDVSMVRQRIAGHFAAIFDLKWRDEFPHIGPGKPAIASAGSQPAALPLNHGT